MESFARHFSLSLLWRFRIWLWTCRALLLVLLRYCLGHGLINRILNSAYIQTQLLVVFVWLEFFCNSVKRFRSVDCYTRIHLRHRIIPGGLCGQQMLEILHHLSTVELRSEKHGLELSRWLVLSKMRSKAANCCLVLRAKIHWTLFGGSDFLSPLGQILYVLLSLWAC